MSSFQMRISQIGSRMGLPISAIAEVDAEDIGQLDEAAVKRGDQIYARFSRLSSEMKTTTPPAQRLFRH